MYKKFVVLMISIFCAGAANSVQAQLTLDLYPGDQGEEVVLLQKILNFIDYTVAISGPGSKGHETNRFGGQTVAALKLFQCDRGIVCEGTPETTGYGAVGPETRGVLNVFAHNFDSVNPKQVEMVSPIQTSTLTPILNLDSFIYSLSAAEPIVAAVADAQTAPAAKIVQVTKTAPVEVKAFTRNLTIGSKGDDVKALQIFLNTHGFSVAQSGVGSPGHETALFGSATQKALSRFQIAQNIKPAVGFFGPATRARVNEMNGL